MLKKLKVCMVVVMAGCLSACSTGGNTFDEIYGAASRGDTETLYEMIENGESLNTVNEHKVTPLCHAYMERNETAIKHLESYSANQGANCLRTKDGGAIVRYVPEHNPPQKQYPQTTNNSVITTPLVVIGTIGAIIGGLVAIGVF